MIFDICLGIAAIWTSACAPPGPQATVGTQNPAGLASLLSAGAIFERVTVRRGVAIRHRPSGLICRFEPASLVRIEVSPEDPALRPATCLTAVKGETLSLLAVPLAGSGGIATLVALERRWIDEEHLEPVYDRGQSEQGIGKTHFIAWRDPRGHQGLFAVTRRREWLIVMRVSGGPNTIAAGEIIWRTIAADLAPRRG